jgi:diamine N-acetyltransferase
MAVTLREITDDNRAAVLALRLAAGEDGGPAGFYARLGFVPTGEVDMNGEVIARLPLA